MISYRYQFTMTRPNELPEADCLAQMLVHLGRAARCEDGTSDLTAAQWTCLRFMARANARTRTPSGFASFHATTRGTASQITKSLECRGLIVRRRSEEDGRSVRFDLTEQGWKLLAQDPFQDLVAAVATLDETERRAFHATLMRLAAQLAARRGLPVFGTCDDCKHLEERTSGAHCACMGRDIDAADRARLCANHAIGAGPAGPDMDTGQGKHDCE